MMYRVFLSTAFGLMVSGCTSEPAERTEKCEASPPPCVEITPDKVTGKCVARFAPEKCDKKDLACFENIKCEGAQCLFKKLDVPGPGCQSAPDGCRVRGCTGPSAATTTPADFKCEEKDETAATTCTSADKCKKPGVCDGNGQCKAEPLDFKDTNECTADSCDAATGNISHSPLSDGPCTVPVVCAEPGGELKCDKGLCKPVKACSCESDAKCQADDKDKCDGDSFCDPVSKTCKNDTASAPPEVDPGTAQCFQMQCNPVDGKPHKVNSGQKACDDDDACTVGETCGDGVCGGSKAKDCNDGKACTNDTCDNDLGCQYTNEADGVACQDGELCTVLDTCSGGQCKSGPPVLRSFIGPTGGPLNDSASGILPGLDGGLIAAVYVNDTPQTNHGVVDHMGADNKILTSPTFPKIAAKNALNALVAVPGGYAVVGVSNPPQVMSVFYAAMVSVDGKTLWEALPQIPDVINFPGYNAAAAVPEGLAAAGGLWKSGDTRYGALHVYSLTNGELKASNSYQHPNFVGCNCHGVAPAAGGGYWLGCAVDKDNGKSNSAWIFRVAKTTGIADMGNIYGADNTVTYPSHLAADNGGVTVVGRTNSQTGSFGFDGWLLRLDNSNKVVFERRLGGAKDDILRAVAQTADGGYVAAGANQGGTSGDPEETAWLIRFDAKGNTMWENTNFPLNSVFVSVAIGADGKIYAAGQAPGTKGMQDPYFAICDAYGNCDCAASGSCIDPAKTCPDDNNPCTLDTCSKGQCASTAGNNNQPCGAGKTCQAGQCK